MKMKQEQARFEYQSRCQRGEERRSKKQERREKKAETNKEGNEVM